MSNTEHKKLLEDIDLAGEFAKFAFQTSMISESSYRIETSRSAIFLKESVDTASVSIRGDHYDIPYVQFYQAYTDITNNRPPDILRAMGVKDETIARYYDSPNQSRSPERAMVATIQDSIKKRFEESRDRLTDSKAQELFPYFDEHIRDVTVAQRPRAYSQGNPESVFNSTGTGAGEARDDVYTKHHANSVRSLSKQDSIVPGVVNNRNQRDNSRASRLAQQANELLSGEFYTNFTRIPKRRWSRWFSLIDRELRSIPGDKRSIGDRLTGRRWKKSFILGYKVEENMIIEIWYNSIDSTFTLHDQNGVNVARRRSPTLTEALRILQQYVAANSETDQNFFSQGGNVDPVMRSLNNALKSDVVKPVRADDEEYERTIASRAGTDKTKKKKSSRASDPTKAGINDVSHLAKNNKTVASMGMDMSRYTDSESPVRKKWVDGSLSHRLSEFLDGVLANATDRIRKDLNDSAYRFIGKFDEYEKDIDDLLVRTDELSSYYKKVSDRYKRETEDLKKRPDDHEAQVEAEDRIKKHKIYKQYYADVIDFSKSVERVKKDLEKKAAEISADVEKHINDKRSTEEEEISPEEVKRAAEDVMRAFREAEREFGSSVKKKAEQLELFDDPKKDEAIRESLENPMFDEPKPTINLSSTNYDRMASRQIKNDRNITIRFIEQSIMADHIHIHHNTQTKPKSFWNTHIVGRDRRFNDPDPRSVFTRVKQFIVGQYYRADFVAGIQLGEDGPTIEIWYVTEPNPNHDGNSDVTSVDSVSSYYVYDIDARLLLKKNVPFYRNALQYAIAKFGAGI